MKKVLVTFTPYLLCTPVTALPDGSFIFLKLLSHSIAISELHAIDGTEGTVNAASSDEKYFENNVL